MTNSDNTMPELKPRVFDEDGNPIAWWSDDFQSVLERHPEIRRLYEKQLENKENKQ